MSDYKAVLSKIINNRTYSPSNPVYAANIVQRARVLLGRRSIEEIDCIDENIRWIMDDCTNTLKQQHGGNFKRHFETELRINNGLDLLKYCIDKYNYSEVTGFKNCTMCDYFAVYALRYIAIAIDLVSIVLPIDAPDIIKDEQYSERVSFSLAFICVALDSVSYAEHLKHTEKIIIENKVLKNENVQLKINKDIEIKIAVKKEISKAKSDAAKKSHAKDYEIRDEVYAWLSDVHKQDAKYLKISNNKIATEILRAEVVDVGYNTLVKYVSEYKKELREAS